MVVKTKRYNVTDGPKAAFESAVATMNIPENRKGATPENARWFLRNGAIMNSNHPEIDKALSAAKKLF